MGTTVRRLTSGLLLEHGACRDQVAKFKIEWPDGCDVTEATVARAVELKLDLQWAAQNLLPQLTLDAYRAAVQPAKIVYLAAVKPASDAYYAAVKLEIDKYTPVALETDKYYAAIKLASDAYYVAIGAAFFAVWIEAR